MGGFLPTSISEPMEKVCKYMLLRFYYFACIYTHTRIYVFLLPHTLISQKETSNNPRCAAGLGVLALVVLVLSGSS